MKNIMSTSLVLFLTLLTVTKVTDGQLSDTGIKVDPAWLLSKLLPEAISLFNATFSNPTRNPTNNHGPNRGYDSNYNYNQPPYNPSYDPGNVGPYPTNYNPYSTTGYNNGYGYYTTGLYPTLSSTVGPYVYNPMVYDQQQAQNNHQVFTYGVKLKMGSSHSTSDNVLHGKLIVELKNNFKQRHRVVLSPE